MSSSSGSLLPLDPRRAPAGPRGRSRARRPGFTLLEVLLVLALIGLLSAVLISGGSQLLNTQPQTPDDVFWAAVQAGRKLALTSDTATTMRYVEDKDQGKAFVLTNGATTRTFAIPRPGDLEVSFLADVKGGNLIMVGGTVIETSKLASVTFYPDGTCSPFRVQFFRDGATHTDAIDQWTCAPVLTPADANGVNNRS